MTNDKQVEVWRAEFAKAIGHNYAVRSDWRYVDVQIDNVWQGFLLAKRSMQPIELPEAEWFYHADNSLCETCSYSVDEIHAAITAAGYSYRVKG